MEATGAPRDVGALLGEHGGLAVSAEWAVDGAGRAMGLEEAAARRESEAWLAAALRGLAALEPARRTGRRLDKLVSLARWPAENRYFREQCPGEWLETHHAVTAVPRAGRLYVSRHTLLVWLGGLWGGELRRWPLSSLPPLVLAGRSLPLPDGSSLSVLSDPEGCAALLEAARLRAAATRVSGVPLATLQAREGAEVPLAFARLVGLLEERAGEEGLFRVSGSGRAVARLARRLDEGGAEGLERAATADLASLLKRLLVEAPPLLHQSGLEGAPAQRAAFVRFLLVFLGRVAARAAENRMTASNLAVCWAPVLCDAPDLSALSAAHDLVLRLLAEHAPPERM